MRCPDCNKFVSYDEPQAEVNSVEVDDNSVRASVTVQLNCADCGTTLKDNEFDESVDIEHECRPEKDRPEGWEKKACFSDGDEQFEIDDEGDASGESRTETKDRHGKPIKNSRYMKTFYGFSMSQDVLCRKCGETFTVDITAEEQASSFNECC